MGMVLPGLIGIFAVQAKAIEDQANNTLLSLQSGPTSTLSSTVTTTPLLSATSTRSPLTNPSLPLSGPGLTLYAFIQAPRRTVARPYVILIAFASIPRTGTVEIRGFVNSQEFICTESPCVIYLQSSSRLVYRAYANTGESSDEVVASVSVTQNLDGYRVNIDSVNQFTSFSDSCSRIWGVTDQENASWSAFVQFPYQLNTSKTLHNLTTRLILSGVVDSALVAVRTTRLSGARIRFST